MFPSSLPAPTAHWPPYFPLTQVIRYTALFSGVLYGWYHRRTLQAENEKHQIEYAIHHREHLITEARQAWKRKQEAAKDTTGQPQHFAFARLFVKMHFVTDAHRYTVVTDPEDPRFDLEKLIAKWEKSS